MGSLESLPEVPPEAPATGGVSADGLQKLSSTPAVPLGPTMVAVLASQRGRETCRVSPSFACLEPR